jgi:aspartyl-tRNA(Asn)/glutamyl-tRNA(Gln) amidotransferase subunit A
MRDELCYLGADELLTAFQAKTLSPVEVTGAVLDRIEAHNEALNCFCLVDGESALAQAQDSEARWARGEPRGLLDGVPLSIKDLVLAKGWPTLKGSLTTNPDQAWDEDGPATARLREHGAVILGKTTTPEFGTSPITESPLTGITRNPWNRDKTTGGSSGGAASSLAAGMGALAIGSDGGGSIRIPAAFCGVYGLKASFGVVPAYPAQPPPLRTLSHVGPMARSVADAALMLAVISEPDDRDWLALRDGPRDFRDILEDGVAGLRIAYSKDLGFAKVEPEVAELTATAVRVFEQLGANVEECDPGFDDPYDDWMVHFNASAPLMLELLSEDQKSLLSPHLQQQWTPEKVPSLTEYFAAAAARDALGQHMARFHRDYDLLLTPAVSTPAFDVGIQGPASYEPDQFFGWSPFSAAFNLTHQPAASAPCGFTSDGLPVGLHIVGPMMRDDLVLRASRAYEQARPTWDRRPDLGA